MKGCKSDEAVSVRVNEEFETALNVLAVSGYEWQVAEADAGLELLGSSIKPRRDSVGGEARQTLRFRARQAGTLRMRLVCKRPWDSSPSETRTVTVTVKAQAPS